ncbi:vitamin K epoxide reductase family protein [Legionella spiritensis]|uniref:vitamin K epoxide reductase family protein n=1 Tax=Legionella spiritensis TaxID=452 RepID=UPI000F6E7956|nr:vitamin K epoxide reductase family protein [Legionella spiritensis]VEG91108.1 NAD dependent epimerase/dehydratase, UDP-glucose-4-epimerase [Legionella spiritensis]
MNDSTEKPIVLITGSSGNLGHALTAALGERYQVVGFDVPETSCDIPFDLTSDLSVTQALDLFRERYKPRSIAAVIHLAAYFDFSGEDSPLYDEVNVAGTRRLLDKLQEFAVERFIYSGTMLVHKPCEIGEKINESDPLAPKWAYPQSKAKTEAVIREHHGNIPYVILRLAGLYNETTCIPTLAHQIARSYERNIKSHLYSGNVKAGQSFIHQSDLIQLFKNAIQYRHNLAEGEIILAGEDQTVSYETLQTTITELLHDEESEIYTIPKPIAKAGAWVQEKSEPVVPDDFDQGEKPFIRPFMIDMASDHYALDISKAQKKLHWQPKHHIMETLPAIIKALKEDPKRWYDENGLTMPDWMQAITEENPETIRKKYEITFRKEHQQNLWAHFINIGLGFWLITSPPTLGYQSFLLTISDVVSGIILVFLASLALSWRFAPVRWLCAGVGLWLVFAPLIFWAPTAGAYLNDTLVGSLVMGFSVLVRPDIGVAPHAAMTGSDIPSGWNFSPSSWTQRLPIIILAFIGLFISRYMAAYQLGHIDHVWEPFFTGHAEDAKNGTEEIITSYVSKLWPIPDAGLGGAVYILEILTGIIGGTNRWRTMPWLVLLFGIMIIPLGVVSITFIIIQPILLNTWCTLCLIAAVAMLLQVPYSFDEIVATSVFLWRRWKAGRPLLKILMTGDRDEESESNDMDDNFEQSPRAIIRLIVYKGITLPWNLVLSLAIGVWLMFSRLTINATDGLANANHLLGALIITITMVALAEVVRPVRFINLIFAVLLCVTPFLYNADAIQATAGIACGVLLFLFTLPRGKIRDSYGEWDKTIF